MFLATDPASLVKVAKVPTLLSVVCRALIVVGVGLAVSLVILHTEDLLAHHPAVLGPTLGGAVGILVKWKAIS